MKQIFAILTGLMLVMPAMLLSSNAYAAKLTGRSVMFEVIIGLDDSKGSNGFLVRYRDGQVESHAGGWFGKKDQDNDNGVLGIGWVVEGEEGDLNVSLTGGGAIVFHKTERYPRRSVLFVRGAAGYQPHGTGDGTSSYEVSLSRYGLVGRMSEYGDSFLGFGYRRLESESTSLPVSDGLSSTDEIPCGGTCDGDLEDDGNAGHGNNEDCFDESNPGNSNGCQH